MDRKNEQPELPWSCTVSYRGTDDKYLVYRAMPVFQDGERCHHDVCIGTVDTMDAAIACAWESETVETDRRVIV